MQPAGVNASNTSGSSVLSDCIIYKPCRGCQPVVEGVSLGSTSSTSGSSSSPAGSGDSSTNGRASNSARGGNVHSAGTARQKTAALAARRAGLRQLHEAVCSHDTCVVVQKRQQPGSWLVSLPPAVLSVSQHARSPRVQGHSNLVFGAERRWSA
jgi:hypothetical protein